MRGSGPVTAPQMSGEAVVDALRPALQARTGPGGILLVCQSDNTLGALAAILHQANETALTAQNSRDAWECIKSGAVACVVQDLTSFNPDAIALFRTARSNRQTASVPFLFLIKSDFIIPKLDGGNTETVKDGWLVLPCSAQQFLNSVRALIASAVAAAQSSDNRARVTVEDQKPGGGSTAMDKRMPPTPPQRPSTGQMLASPKPVNEHDLLSDMKGSVFGGRLGALDFTKILSMVESLRMTGSFRVSDGKRVGTVYFVDGRVWHAELNEIEGPDALFLLFHMKSGTFRFDVEPATTKRTIEGNTMTLLLEGLRQMDEAKALVMAFKERRQSGRMPRVEDSSTNIPQQ